MAINIPEKKQSTFSKIVSPVASLVGAGIGTLIAPGAGTALGASLGGALGGAAKGVAQKDAGAAIGGIAGAAAAAGSASSDAMQRRLEESGALADGGPTGAGLGVDTDLGYGGDLAAMRRRFGYADGGVVQKPQDNVPDPNKANAKAMQKGASESGSKYIDWNNLMHLGMANGGEVPGRAQVRGDSPQNDTVLAILSPGEGVVPRSEMHGEMLKKVESYPNGGGTSDATKALNDGLDALAHLPPEQQQAYGPQIMNAYQRSLRRDFRGIA